MYHFTHRIHNFTALRIVNGFIFFRKILITKKKELPDIFELNCMERLPYIEQNSVLQENYQVVTVQLCAEIYHTGDRNQRK